jgi:hypothetical protein
VRPAGADVQVTEFPGAAHGFDFPTSSGGYLGNVQSSARCRIVEMSPGGYTVYHAESGRRSTDSDSCFSRGATVGYHGPSHQAAIAAVKQFLTATFRLVPR